MEYSPRTVADSPSAMLAPGSDERVAPGAGKHALFPRPYRPLPPAAPAVNDLSAAPSRHAKGGSPTPSPLPVSGAPEEVAASVSPPIASGTWRLSRNGETKSIHRLSWSRRQRPRATCWPRCERWRTTRMVSARRPSKSPPQTASRTEPPARSIRRSRVEELPAEPPSTRRESEPTDPQRAKAAAAARTPFDIRKAPDTPSTPSEGDELFRPVDDGVNRSPAALAARLARAFGPPAPPHPGRAITATRTASVQADTPSARPGVAGTPSHDVPPASRRTVTAVPTSPEAERMLTPLVGVDPSTSRSCRAPRPRRRRRPCEPTRWPSGRTRWSWGPGSPATRPGTSACWLTS